MSTNTGQLTCDTCGEDATHVHVLPWVTTAEKVELTCDGDCDPGGYWFPIRKWRTGPPDRERSGTYTTERHVELKRGGGVAAVLVNERLGI